MDVEELKKKTILVQYIVNDVPPSEGYSRMQYYTAFSEAPEDFHFGLSINTSYSKETLERQLKSHRLIKLPESFVLPFKKDLYLSSDNKVIAALGWDVSEEQEVIQDLNNL